ncbi:MAG: hypothetical protein K2Q26_10040 [Bdellovibrionales bacterium]|nr:hypothetical protein [Bdellovibrionales bacterium]
MKLYSILSIAAFLFISQAGADTPTFDNLSDGDLETIAKDFSSIFVHTSASPPTASIVGIQAAVVAGAAEVPGIREISRRVDPNSDIKYAPFAFLYAGVGLPLGFNLEANILPQMKLSGFELSHYSGAVRYSLTDELLPVLPFNWSVRTFYSKSAIKFDQYIAPGTVNVDFDNNMLGVETIVGVDLLFVEPYAGIGWVTSNSELEGNSTVDPAFSMYADNVSRSKKSTVDSARLIAGVQFNLTIIRLGLEYNSVFGNSRYALKLGFAF